MKNQKQELKNKASKKMEIGKTYQHKNVGTVVKVKGKYYGKCERLEYYQVVVINENNKPLLLPKAKSNEWEEVVIDCDGLVYKLTQKGD